MLLIREDLTSPKRMDKMKTLTMGYHTVSNNIQGMGWFIDRGQATVDMDGNLDSGRVIDLKPVFSGIWCHQGDGKAWVASTLEEAYSVLAKMQDIMARREDNKKESNISKISEKYGDIFTEEEVGIIALDAKLASNLLLGRKPVRVTSAMEGILQKCGII